MTSHNYINSREGVCCLLPAAVETRLMATRSGDRNREDEGRGWGWEGYLLTWRKINAALSSWVLCGARDRAGSSKEN